MDFSEVLEAHGELIRRIVAKYSRQYSEADDLWQEACIAVWQAIPRFDPQRGPQAAFFYRCAYNAVLRQVENDSRYYARNISVCGNSAEDTPAGDLTLMEVEEIIFQAKQKCQLRSFRRGLYAIRRKMEGCSYRETAKELGISAATMKRHCKQAVRILEKFI